MFVDLENVILKKCSDTQNIYNLKIDVREIKKCSRFLKSSCIQNINEIEQNFASSKKLPCVHNLQ